MPGVQATLASGDWLLRLRLTFSHVSDHHSDSSNPTASTGVDRYQTGTCKTPVFWRLARLEKRIDLESATRNTTSQAPCTELHWRYRTPKQLARNAKNPWENQGFAAERTETELFDGFPTFLKQFERYVKRFTQPLFGRHCAGSDECNLTQK
jgi:hypothetical protein